MAAAMEKRGMDQAGLKQAALDYHEHPTPGAAKPIRQHAACRAGTDDDVVVGRPELL